MKVTSGCCCARRERNVFSAKGQPQWRRKVRIVDLWFELGGMSLPGMDGAEEPILERWGGRGPGGKFLARCQGT